MDQSMHHMLNHLSQEVDRMDQSTHHMLNHLSQEVDLVFNSLVREVTRLEMQVEALRHVVQGRADARDGLSLVDVAGEEHDVEPLYPEERMEAVG